MKAFSDHSNPLIIPVCEAKTKLESWYQIGHNLHDKVEKAYNDDHFETPIDILAIRSFLKKIQNWLNSVSSELGGIYTKGEYVNRFMKYPLDNNKFTLTPAILKANLVQIYKGSNYRNRILQAKPAEMKQIMKEIMKDVGPIEPHWNAEKSRMVANLNERLKGGLDYLDDRIAYLDEFGNNSSALAVELPILSCAEEFESVFPHKSISKFELSSFDEFWAEAFRLLEENKGMINAFRCAKQKFLREPIRPIINFDSFAYSKDDYFSIRDRIASYKSRYIHELTSQSRISISELIPSLSASLPEYDYENHSISLEKLKDYGINLVYSFKCLPEYIVCMAHRTSESSVDMKIPEIPIKQKLGSFNVMEEDYSRLSIDGEEIFLNKCPKLRALIEFMHNRAKSEGNKPVLASFILLKIGSKGRLTNLFKRKEAGLHPCHKLILNVGNGKYIFAPSYLKN